MALSESDLSIAASRLAVEIFVQTGTTAHSSSADLKEAVREIDTTMDKLPAALNSGLTVKQNFLADLPEPFKSNATNAEKAFALMAWALKETGVI